MTLRGSHGADRQAFSGAAVRLPALLARLTRLRLSLAVATSAVAGLLLGERTGGLAALIVFGGVWALAAAASALNQVQEADIDARMRRTRHRPLPAGQLRPAVALAIAAILGAAGLTLLAGRDSTAATLGLASLICYNGLYTPLKRHTALALFPGALCGALPPLIGWCAGGGSPTDFRIVLPAVLLFLWQLPHFWRLAERNAADYRRAGLPLLQDSVGEKAALMVRAAWPLAMAAVALLLPLFGLLQTLAARLLLLAVTLVLAGSALAQFRGRPQSQATGPRLACADVCLLLLLLILLGERLGASPAALLARL